MAIDSKSKVFGARNDALTMNLRPDTKARVEQSGLRVLNRIDLPPGRYQVRVAARDSAKTNIGTVVYDLDVPDFYKQTISLSGIALTSLGGAAMMTAKPDDQLKTVLPAPPVAARTFARNDELAIFAEVYDNSGSQPHKVDIVARVLTDEGRELYKNEESHDSSELQGAKGGYGYAARIPLSEIPPGTYVLNIEAHSRLATRPPSRRKFSSKWSRPDRATRQKKAGNLWFPAFLVSPGIRFRTSSLRGYLAAGVPAGVFGASSVLTLATLTVPLACVKFQLLELIFVLYGVSMVMV